MQAASHVQTGCQKDGASLLASGRMADGERALSGVKVGYRFYSADGKLLIETRNPFAVGDKLEILSPGSAGRSFTVESIESEEGESMQRSAVPMRRLRISAPDGIKAQDILRKRV